MARIEDESPDHAVAWRQFSANVSAVTRLPSFIPDVWPRVNQLPIRERGAVLTSFCISGEETLSHLMFIGLDQTAVTAGQVDLGGTVTTACSSDFQDFSQYLTNNIELLGKYKEKELSNYIQYLLFHPEIPLYEGILPADIADSTILEDFETVLWAAHQFLSERTKEHPIYPQAWKKVVTGMVATGMISAGLAVLAGRADQAPQFYGAQYGNGGRRIGLVSSERGGWFAVTKRIFAQNPSLSPNRELVAFFDGATEHQLVVIDQSKQEVAVLPVNGSIQGIPAWFPDNQHLVVSLTEQKKPYNSFLYLADLLTRRSRLLTQGMFPSVSPTGQWIAFTDTIQLSRGNYPTATATLAVIQPDGNGKKTISEYAHAGDLPAWSPDGTRIAYTRRYATNAEILITNVATGITENLTNSDNDSEWSPAWSPDGTHIAYISDKMPGANLYIRNLTTGAETQISTGFTPEMQPYWSPDGTKIMTAGRFGSEPSTTLLIVDVKTKQIYPRKGVMLNAAWK